MKNLYILICLIFVSLDVFAQPQMRFDRESMDVGTILWANPTTAEFKVTNTGNSLLVMNSVDASCACTTVEWPEKGLEPGETASIKAVFDAKALGTFYKEVEIKSNASSDPVYLQFTGRVVANAEDVTNTEGYDIVMGDVRINKDAIEFDQVSKGTDPVEELLVLNTSRASFEPILMHVPEYLEVSCYPERIPAGRTGRIRIKLLTDKLRDMGLTQTSVYFTRSFGDKVGSDNEIPVSAILLPDFSELSSVSLANAPKMQLSGSDLKILLKGKKKGKGVVTVTNTGKSALQISRLQVLSNAVGVTIPKKSVAPGESINMKVTYDSSMVKKNRRPAILMITNDPEHAEQIIHITTD